ncbi:helix-turn-helix transcriptional regulator [Sphaerisporangium sp. NBC_01403]|uniref:helix-turn-helix domain-containing protein n=1 Tax=Sphaerisporangium sp. NBC_01403 TaxID=2903599 RepID=UPI00324D0C46
MEPAVHGPLGAALRQARRRAGLTLRAAAHGTGISYSTLSRIENGRGTAPSLDVAMAVARKVGLGEREVLRLAGPLARGGAIQLADPGIRRALTAGRLSPDALSALRREHLRELASEFSASLGAGRPVDMRMAAKQVGLELVACRTGAGFDCGGATYRIPAAAGNHVSQRSWIARGIAHRLIAGDSGSAPECRPGALSTEEEREATYVAAHVLVPRPLLAAELRKDPLPASAPAVAFTAALERMASRFHAPASWAAARLTEDRIGELPW